MRVRDIWQYLKGNRRAILEIAHDTRAPVLGLLFVLSAGLAREYDGEDLLHEPWHLLIPVAVSLPASILLFLVALIASRKADGPRRSLPGRYWSFLGLFWMTAPLAWLYAIPYERFLSAYGATQANLWTLGIVAAWRVLLMTRVVSVLSARSFWAALFPVMLVADGLALLALSKADLPVIAIMGGVRLTEAENLLVGVAFNVMALGLLSLPVWAIGTIVVLTQRPPVRTINLVEGPSRTSFPTVALAAVSVLVWALVLPATQPPQQLRRQVEADYRGERFEMALKTMSAHLPGDFPPHWDPPPRGGCALDSVLKVTAMTARPEVAGWVRGVYVEKLGRQMDNHFFWYHLDKDNLQQLAHCLRTLPEGAALIDRHRASIVELIHRSEKDPSEDSPGLRLLAQLINGGQEVASLPG